MVPPVVASWARIAAAAALTYLLAQLAGGHPVDWSAMGIAAAVATLPVVINWLNPADPRYGRVGGAELDGPDDQDV